MNESRLTFRCALPKCSGLNDDGTCPFGLGVTCESTNEHEEDISLFVERLRTLAEDWRYSDELIGLVVRRRWPQRYDNV